MTNTMGASGTVLKRDEAGRVQTPAERRERLLEEFDRSGLSGAKFAALAGIKYSTFATWAARRRKRVAAAGPEASAAPVRWLEAVVAPVQPPGGAVVVQLPGGGRVELHDLQQVALTAALLRTLGQPC
jgi:acetyl esterase/lipase